MAFSERPSFFLLDNDRTVELRKYAESDVRAVAKAFKEQRLDTLRLLSSLPALAWKRTGLHPKRGEMTIEQVAEHLANHDATHLGRIRELASR
jgi:pyruvate-formate lyase-activating enzyme